MRSLSVSLRGRSLARSLLLVLVAALAGLAVFAAPSPAPVPPQDCKFMTVGKQRYNIRSDQLRCRPARRYAKAYLRKGKRPSGYRCVNYGRETAIDFRCTKGKAVFFAIRR